MEFICRLHHEVYILSKMGEHGTTIINRNVVKNFMQTYETGRLFHLMQILHEPYISDPEPAKEPANESVKEPAKEPDTHETENEYVRVPPCVTV